MLTINREVCNVPPTILKPGAVSYWFVVCPSSHPHWNNYLVSLIHLRDIPGVVPATISVEEATHECVVMALDPKEEMDAEKMSTILSTTLNIPYLKPINIAQQFKAENDAQAMNMVEQALEGIPSMDSDYRRAWELFLTKQVEVKASF